MISISVVLSLLIAGALILYLYLKSTGGRRAALGSVPMGVYLRARDKGATPDLAITDAIQVLRYREPWASLSDAELSAAAVILSTLHDPKNFVSIVMLIEESGRLDFIRDRTALENFVRDVNARDPKR